MSNEQDQASISIERPLTRQEVAELAGRHPTTVAEDEKAGRITGHRIGRAVRYSPAEVRRYLGIRSTGAE